MEKQCNKCGYIWAPRIANPKCCPDCKSRGWDIGKNAAKATAARKANKEGQ